MKATRKTTSFDGRRRFRRGFTLVELIVVLTILAILAAIGIGSATAYIRKSRFDRNSEHAVTVYQAAQNALSQKVSDGTVDSWIRGLKRNDGSTFLSHMNTLALDDPNESVNEVFSLTYNPSNSTSVESEELYALLAPYFYDMTVFQGTITVEFDVSATFTVDEPYYSARVLSAFYSIQNDPQEQGLRWDDVCTNDKATTDGLPYRPAEYRYTTSFVGYYNGSEDSIKPRIASVFVPQSQVYELDGHIVGPTDDPTAISANYLFNMRNGETLDVSWAIFDEDGGGAAHDRHDENLTITLSDAGVGNNGSSSDVVISIPSSALNNLRYTTMPGEAVVTYESISTYDIIRSSKSGFITVNVTIGDAAATSMKFPITVTLVENDGRTGCPKAADGETPVAYYEYRMSLDCMMQRSYESGTDGFNIRRLFSSPTNIIAKLDGTYKHYNQGGGYDSAALTIPTTYAARAIDDPVYYTGLVSEGGHTAYRYDVRPGAAINDQNDFDHVITGEPVTGKCVVNTMFGDATYSISTDASAGETIAATEWVGGKVSAVITSFRHMYNVRWIASTTPADFRIIRDLNWYVQESGKLIVSEVKVYTTTGFKSPASAGNIQVVSFPAIPDLYGGQSLIAMSKRSGGGYYSINNLQMRAASFRIGTDGGYGLICKNRGNVVDIHTNNFNLVIANVTDGGNDYDSIFRTSISLTGTENGCGALGNKNNDRPLGGLVGLNVDTGVVGQADGSIVMSNTIIMCNNYWTFYADVSKIGTGGVVGKNEHDVVGTLEINGRFAIVGRDNVGGLIGLSTSNVEARLLVNVTEAPDADRDLPYYNNAALSDNSLPCVLISRNNIGAAIGQLQGASLTYGANNPFTYAVNPENGVFSSVNNNNFQIDVNLGADSLIYMVGGYKTNNNTSEVEKPGAGGAVGFMNGVPASTSSIRVNNAGSIITNDTSNSYCCGGVVGRDYDCSNNMNIDFNNQGGRIGYFTNANGPIACGGAIGHILSTHTGRVIAINGVNSGTITARGKENGQGAGGAIGGVNSGSADIDFRINVVNTASSVIIGTGSDTNNGNGVGGAIGAMGNKDADDSMTIPASSVIRAVNGGTINGAYHVGGAVGNVPANYGKIYAVNSGLINGNDYVGGAIGRTIYSNYGTIQSTLESGAMVHGQRFTGGAAGRVLNCYDGSQVITVVKGNSEVIGNNGSLVGGVCGDITIAGTGSDIIVQLKGDGSAPTLTVSGNDGVGGVAGILRANVVNSAQIRTPNQSATNKLVMRISGGSYVGGAIGVLRSTSKVSVTPSDLISSEPTDVRIMVNVSVVLSGESIITGTGSDVGGAVGRINSNNAEFGGSISVSSAGYSQTASLISGLSNVGGAVGHFHNTKPAVYSSASAITVAFDVDYWNIKANVGAGNDSNVGGAVGYFDGTRQETGITYPITVNLGFSSVTGNGRNVGGVIGKNTSFNGNVDLTSMSGTVCGQRNVGGAIGYDTTYVNAVQATVIGRVYATGETYSSNTNGPTETVTEADAGGAIGFINSGMGTVSATVIGMVQGGGINDGDPRCSNVGGAIGYSYSTNAQKYWIISVTADIQGNGLVRGAHNVGGAIGINSCNIQSVTSVITGTSKVAGDNRVGGAIGFASANPGIGGGEVLKGTSCGRIDFVSSEISANDALSGNSRIGGAIGQIGNKWGDGNNYISAVVVRVEATINAGRLFDTDHTGPEDPSQDVCVGGVVGHFVDGRLGVAAPSTTYDAAHTPGVYLKGSGGVVHTPYPDRTYSGTVLMAARGSTIGGIIGQLGVPGYQQNVCVTNISAQGGPGLCVMSTNGGNCIGGWIGAGYATHGGIGNETSTNTPVVYDVSNVRTVYSSGSEVGGFMGRLNAQNGNSTTNKGIYATINVNLSRANVTGRTQVGGAFGSFTSGWFTKGGINVTLSDHSNIGDITGNALPGERQDYDAICYECGGAIGFVNSPSGSNNYNCRLYVPVRIYSDSTSRIWAGGTTSDTANPVTNFGVGGAFGRFNSFMNADTRIEVTTTSNSTAPVYVYSASSNVGGIAGVWLDRGMITDGSKTDVFKENTVYASANVTVRGIGANAGVGGFAGRINAGSVLCSRVTGSVTTVPEDVVNQTAGADISAGGFAGYIAGGTLKYCSTTATVNSVSGGASCTGGFAGYIAKGKIDNSYVGGHTFQGQYIAGEGNVTGIDNVGGFVGILNGPSADTILNNCYSTASVLGSGQNVGGFAGDGRQGRITNSYCSGLVSGAGNAGAFAGISGGLTLNSNDKNQALNTINLGQVSLVGREGDPVTGINWASVAQINNNQTYTAHAFDTTLTGNFPLRAVINREHYGDWSIGSSGGTSIENAEVTIDSGDELHPDWFPYRRAGVEIADYLTVSVEGVTLTYGEDYTLGYKDNDRIGTATVQIAGIGDYTGAISRTFVITTADITDAQVVVNTPEVEYTGAPVIPDITVTLAGEVLAYNVDYYFKYSPNNTDIGTVTVTVEGTGNYSGTAAMQVQFEIVGADISNAQVTLVGVESLVYNGSAQIPQAVVVRYGGQQLTEGTDYEVRYEDNVHAGNDTAQVVISGIGSYRGDKTVRFSIATATNAWETEPSITGWTWGEPMSVPVGSARYGTVQFRYYSDSACEDEVDITTADAGTYYMEATVVHDDPLHTNDYDLPVPKVISFTISQADLSAGAVVIDPPEYVYTGAPIRPTTITVTVGTRTLTDADFTVTYPSDITSVGTKPIVITGTGNYTGTLNASYDIYYVFSVRFITGEGATQIDTQNIREGGYATEPQKPVLSGYSFHGWFTSTSYSEEYRYNFNTPVTRDVILYAYWIRSYTFTFVTGEGATPVPSQQVDQGTPATRPSNPSRDGFAFGGWYTDPGCTIPYNFDALVYEDRILYAKWIPEYTVSFVTGEGADPVASQTVAEGGTATEPSAPGRSGYTFLYWARSSEAGAAAFDFSSPIMGNTVIYAQWEED